MANYPKDTMRTLVVHLPELDAQLLLNLAEEDGLELEKFLARQCHLLHFRRHFALGKDDRSPCRRANCYLKRLKKTEPLLTSST